MNEKETKHKTKIEWNSVQFSHSVMSDSLWPHELQHSRLPCPLPTPWVYSNSCPFSRWCHPSISSSVIPFSSHFQSFPASGSFQMSQLFTSGGQSIGVSASTSVLPMNIQDWFSLGWTGWISLLSKGLSRVFSNATVPKHQFFSTQLSYNPILTYIRGPGAAERRHPTSKVRSGTHEEKPQVQGQKQWLCFAGAAVKWYPMAKVRETAVRW